MTTINDDSQASAEVKPAPLSSSNLQIAGESGSRWYDFSEAARISSAVWDRTISNTDDYRYGEVLFAVNSNPAIQPDSSLPATMSSILTAVFQQMVFTCITYEIICSKGSLTNAKFILAFIPGMSLTEFEELPRAQRLNVCDRQSQKIIFSPNPNQAQVLNAYWSHVTSIAKTDESQGVVALLIYQQVVANIADGGTNEIRLTCRMSTEGLKLRYPMPPGTTDVDNSSYFDDIKNFEPQNPQEFERESRWADVVELPQATFNSNPTPLMVAVPSFAADEIPLEDVINAQAKDGTEVYSKTGSGVFTEIYRRTFTARSNVGLQAPVSTHFVKFGPITEVAGKLDFFTEIHYPWIQPADSEITDSTLTAGGNMIILIVNQDTGESQAIKAGTGIISTFKDGQVFIQFPHCTTLEQTQNIVGAATIVGSVPLHFDVHWNDPSINLKNTDIQNLPQTPADSHTIFWSELPPKTDPEVVVEEMLTGVGMPAICNLVNQIGSSQQDRNPDELKADLVIGNAGTRDFFETLGQVIHTAEQYAPLLLSFLKSADAIVVEATSTNPIHYVPTGGKQIRKFGPQSLQKRLPERTLRTTVVKAAVERAQRLQYTRTMIAHFEHTERRNSSALIKEINQIKSKSK